MSTDVCMVMASSYGTDESDARHSCRHANIGANNAAPDLVCSELFTSSVEHLIPPQLNSREMRIKLCTMRQQKKLLSAAYHSEDRLLRWLLRQLDLFYRYASSLQLFGSADCSDSSCAINAAVDRLIVRYQTHIDSITKGNAAHESAESSSSFSLSTGPAKDADHSRLITTLHDGVSGVSSACEKDAVQSLIDILHCSDTSAAASVLAAVSSCVGSCTRLWQAGCVPALLKLAHASPDDRQLRQAASQALLTAAQHRRPIERRILRLLRQLREFSERVSLLTTHEQSLKKSDDEDVSNKPLLHPLPSLTTLLKMSFNERRRHEMRFLGAVQSLCEILLSDIRVHDNRTTSDSTLDIRGDSEGQSDCTLLRRYAIMSLTNLTFGQSVSKAIVTSQPLVLRALVDQLKMHNGSHLYGDKQSVLASASLLRNLSWRADSDRRRALRDCDALTVLAEAVVSSSEEPLLRCILSAIWNLSAHCHLNRAKLCDIDGFLPFLVKCISADVAANGEDALSGRSSVSLSEGISSAVAENASGILRNLSVHLVLDPFRLRQFVELPCLSALLGQLTSSSLIAVHNASATLCCLATSSVEVRRQLLQLGAVARLKNLSNSDHKSIADACSTTLCHVVSASNTLEVHAFKSADPEACSAGSDRMPSSESVELGTSTREANDISVNDKEDTDSRVSTPSPIANEVYGDKSPEILALSAENDDTLRQHAVKMIQQWSRSIGISDDRMKRLLLGMRNDASDESSKPVDSKHSNELSNGASPESLQQTLKPESTRHETASALNCSADSGDHKLLVAESRESINYRARYLSGDSESAGREEQHDDIDELTDFSARYGSGEMIMTGEGRDDCDHGGESFHVSFMDTCNDGDCSLQNNSADEPTNFSMRYAESDEANCAFKKPATGGSGLNMHQVSHRASKQNRCPVVRAMDVDEDTIQTYATEGTPCLGTPHTFSTAVSLLDLRESASSAGVVRADESAEAEVVARSSDRAAVANSTTANVGRMSVAETPLVFSRSSSIGSLDSSLMIAAENTDGNEPADLDEHHSVASEYSRPVSDPVSPSELPDSPGDQPRGPLILQREQCFDSTPPAPNHRAENDINFGAANRVCCDSQSSDLQPSEKKEQRSDVSPTEEKILDDPQDVPSKDRVCDSSKSDERLLGMFNIDDNEEDDNDMIYACIKSAMPTYNTSRSRRKAVLPKFQTNASSVSQTSKSNYVRNNSNHCSSRPFRSNAGNKVSGDCESRQQSAYLEVARDGADAASECDDALLDQMIRQSMHDRHSRRHRSTFPNMHNHMNLQRSVNICKSQADSRYREITRKQKILPRTPPSVPERARVYAVEGTPLNFSTATSLSDLTIDDIQPEPVGLAEDVDSRPEATSKCQFRSCEDSSHVYATEDTPAVFSRCDSLSDIVTDANIGVASLDSGPSVAPAIQDYSEPRVGDSASSLASVSNTGNQQPSSSLVKDDDDGSETDDMLLERFINSAMPKSRSETSVRHQRRQKQRVQRPHHDERRCSSRDVSSRVRSCSRPPAGLSPSALTGGSCGSVRVLASFSPKLGSLDRQNNQNYVSSGRHRAKECIEGVVPELGSKYDVESKRHLSLSDKWRKENIDKTSVTCLEADNRNDVNSSKPLRARILKPTDKSSQSHSSGRETNATEIKTVRGRRKVIYQNRGGFDCSTEHTTAKSVGQSCLSPRSNRTTHLRQVFSASNDNKALRMRSENSSPANSTNGSPMFQPRRFGSAGKGGVVMCQLPRRDGNLKTPVALSSHLSVSTNEELKSPLNSPVKVSTATSGLGSKSGSFYPKKVTKSLNWQSGDSGKSTLQKQLSKITSQMSAVFPRHSSTQRALPHSSSGVKHSLVDKCKEKSALKLKGKRTESELNGQEARNASEFHTSGVLKKQGTFTLDVSSITPEAPASSLPSQVQSLANDSCLQSVPLDSISPAMISSVPLANSSSYRGRYHETEHVAVKYTDRAHFIDTKTKSHSNKESRFSGRQRCADNQSPNRRGKVIITDL